jgi:hypothetical protein
MAHANAGNASHAEALLHQMMITTTNDLQQTTRPNVKSFGIVMDAWAKSRAKDAALHAERLLNQLPAHIPPNAVLVSSCISAWSRSPLENAAERASQLLEQMRSSTTTLPNK